MNSSSDAIPASLRRDIERAGELLRAGGVVAMPTETVYGLAANALNPQAAARIFEIKGRPKFDPLIVHATDREQVETLVSDFPAPARRLADALWPGPLTLVLPRREIVPDIVTSGLPTVAVRVPNHAIARAMIRAAGVPLAAPSANQFGAVSPTTAQHVRDELGSAVDMVIDGGPCATGVESTIIEWDEMGQPLLLRPGGLPVEMIEQILGPVRRATDAQKRPQAPGMLPRHYAPRTPMRLLESLDALPNELPAPAGLLVLNPPLPQIAARFAVVETLSITGDLHEAAANLFAAMRRLDARNLSSLWAVRVPEQGLGVAINDRLRRAAEPE